MQGGQGMTDRSMIDNIMRTQYGPSENILKFAHENTSKSDYFTLTNGK